MTMIFVIAFLCILKVRDHEGYTYKKLLMPGFLHSRDFRGESKTAKIDQFQTFSDNPWEKLNS
jgi:hypothetical protein